MSATFSRINEFRQSRVKDLENAWNRNIEKGDLSTASFNLNSQFDNYMMLGVAHWRQNLDPRPYLQEAFDGCFKRLSILKQLDPHSDYESVIPHDASLYVAYLLNRDHPPVDFRRWNGRFAPQNFFGNVLFGRADIRDWADYAKELPVGEKYELMNETYQLYAQLLAGDISHEEGVALGEDLFAQREDDEFVNDPTDYEGWDVSNEFVVDFRLAAILKKIGSTVPTIHAWKW